MPHNLQFPLVVKADLGSWLGGEMMVERFGEFSDSVVGGMTAGHEFLQILINLEHYFSKEGLLF